MPEAFGCRKRFARATGAVLNPLPAGTRLLSEPIVTDYDYQGGAA